jgi:cysteinyl-tRNA synthetase
VADAPRSATFIREGLFVLGLYDPSRRENHEPEVVLSAEQAAIAAEREEARKNRDYVKSDKLRETLRSLGIDVKDNKDGSVYRRIE